MFKGLANIGSMLRQAQQLGGKMQEVQEKLKEMRATGSAGAGMVTVEVNGLGDVLKVSIEPQLVEKGDREMIEDLIPAAVNQASAKAKQLHVQAMQSLTNGLDVPGLNEAISQMTGAPVEDTENEGP